MSPTRLFSLDGPKIPKTGQVSSQNGPNSCQNAQIEAFRGEMSVAVVPRHTPPLKRYYLQNLDKRVAQGGEKEILAATGLSRQLFYQLKTGKTEYAKHWRIKFYEENGVRKGILLQGSKRKYIIFFKEGSHVLKRTRLEFARLTGLDPNYVYSRVRNRQTIDGWNYEAEII